MNYCIFFYKNVCIDSLIPKFNVEKHRKVWDEAKLESTLGAGCDQRRAFTFIRWVHEVGRGSKEHGSNQWLYCTSWEFIVCKTMCIATYKISTVYRTQERAVKHHRNG